MCPRYFVGSVRLTAFSHLALLNMGCASPKYCICISLQTPAEIFFSRIQPLASPATTRAIRLPRVGICPVNIVISSIRQIKIET
jgi:hypothetical protein